MKSLATKNSGFIKVIAVIAVVAVIGVTAFIFVDYKAKIKPKNGPSKIYSPFGNSSNPKYKKDSHKVQKRIDQFNKTKERPKKIGL